MRFLFFILVGLFPPCLSAQVVSGKVVGNWSKPISGATIRWLGADTAYISRPDGVFFIPNLSAKFNSLIAEADGFEADTLPVSDLPVLFRLKKVAVLNAVTINGKRPGIYISRDPIKNEIITQVELKKAACCDLAGCFETKASVQPQVTNVVTNAKELRILGLSGVYNQVLIDGLPTIQALTFTYGISGIPGTLVDNIYITKGANSVLQGFESMSGQINVITKEPNKTDKMLLNAYANNFGEHHLNGNFYFKVKKWQSLAAFHVVQPAAKFDRDQDNFLDLPKLTRYMALNKWSYGNENSWGWSSRISLRFLNERRIGGQTNFNPEQDKGSTTVYGQSIAINQPELTTKTAYRFNDEHRIAFMSSLVLQDQNSWFGTLRYQANQVNSYANIQYERNYGNSNSIKTGFSLRQLQVDENIAFTESKPIRMFQGNYAKNEWIPGLFAENVLQLWKDKITWIAGLRSDHHNRFGIKITPRTLIKWDIAPQSTLRVSAGTGWRTVNLFSENVGLLASSRNIVIAENLKPEQATNLGGNYTQKFAGSVLSGHFSADFYHTRFLNQIFPDYDADPTQAIVKNFTGTSIGNGFQAEVYLKILERFEYKAGYNYLDVYRIVEGEKLILPFNATHKILNTFSYKPLHEKYHIDLNLHWFGQQRLPNTQSNPEGLQRPDFSKAYTTLNAQFTWTLKKVELYTGMENIFDFRQRQPILSWQNPFSPYFDTSSVWGPTRGREIYAGLRFMLK